MSVSIEPVLDTARIDYLIDASRLARLRVAVVGLGSGGATVVERLAMCGFSRWALFDPDVLEPVNLVKHPARRADLGRAKVDIVRDWLLDRHPGAAVDAYRQDVTGAPAFDEEIRRADVVICGVDTPAARAYVNSRCVAAGTACVFASVFRTGLGGEVYAYLPGEAGCHECKLRYVEEQGADLDSVLEMTPDEEHHIYGLGQQDYVASGLAVDIGIVAGLHAHYVVSLLGSRGSKYLQAPGFNWLTVGLRRMPGLFGTYETFRLRLLPRVDCVLNCATPRSP